MNPASSDRRRRLVRGLLSGLLLLTALFLVTAPGVDAARSWCRTDPIISINGQIVDVLVLAPNEDLSKITGATRVEVTVSSGVNAKLIATDRGFGFGETVTFSSSDTLRATAQGIDVDVRVYVPATSSTVPIQVQFVPRSKGLVSPASVTGTANSWVVLHSTF